MTPIKPPSFRLKGEIAQKPLRALCSCDVSRGVRHDEYFIRYIIQ